MTVNAVPLARSLLDRYGAAVEPCRACADQCEADARPLVGPPRCALHSIEALEDTRQVLLVDAGPCVANEKPRDARIGLDADGDLPFEGELKGVGDEIEDDLLPHLPVDENRLGDGAAIQGELQTASLHERTKGAGDLRREGADVGRRVGRSNPPGLEAAELHERVHQLEQAKRVAVDRLLPLPLPRRERLDFAVHQTLLHGSEHQRERRPELVAHVAESEDRLRAVLSSSASESARRRSSS